MYRIIAFALIVAVSVCAAASGAHAQVEYGTSTAAFVDVAGIGDGPDSEENLGGTSASAHAELDGVVADSIVGMNQVSCLTQITDTANSDAYTYSTFFWDTFTATSTSLPSGTPTTVTFWVELSADLSASSNDPGIDSPDLVSSFMSVGVYSVQLTDGAPDDVLENLFVGSAALDAVTGLHLQDDLIGSGFQAVPGDAGYSANLRGFAVPLDVETTVGSAFSLKFSGDTLSSVAPELTDGTAVADLRNGLRIAVIRTDAGVDLVRASGVTGPPASGVTGYKTVIDDVKVTYNRGGCFARYNELDGTLMIDIWEDDGTLNVICGEDASTYWGPQCDVYIYAPDVSIKNINLKGRPETELHVCGQVGYVKNFKLKYGFVGDTDYYDPDFGLGSDAQDPANRILIKWGATAAPLLGVEYTELRSAPALHETGNAELRTIELKQKPFAVLFDEADADIDEEVGPEERAFAADAVLAETKAAYKFESGDVTVIYSEPGCLAYLHPSDETLTIEILENDGILTVKCGENAYVEWGDFCDIRINAPDASVKTMILKGRPETQLHVCGEVGYVKNFKLKYGSVGDTEYYGPEIGLANTSLELPNKILIKWGWTTAPVLGVSSW